MPKVATLLQLFGSQSIAPGWICAKGGQLADHFSTGLPRCLRGWVKGEAAGESVTSEFKKYDHIQGKPANILLRADTIESKTAFVHYKAVLCAQEYCPDCGQKNSWVHNRRIARWLPKGFQFVETGYSYLVVTFPVMIRKYLRDQHTLNDIRKYFKRKLKREGITQGLGRWHWFGDCKSCKGVGCGDCKGTGAGNEFHPHLNFLFAAEWFTKADLEKWRGEFYKAIAKILRKKYKTNKSKNFRKDLREFKKVNFHVQYEKGLDTRLSGEALVKDQERIIGNLFHAIEYVTRATFRIYDFELSQQLYAYRNTFQWGKWEKLSPVQVTALIMKLNQSNKKEVTPEKKETLRRLSHYTAGECPFSFLKINWTEFLPPLETFKILTHCVDFTDGGYFTCTPEIIFAPPELKVNKKFTYLSALK